MVVIDFEFDEVVCVKGGVFVCEMLLWYVFDLLIVVLNGFI